jgi:S1-C subfamily serine protease
VGDRDREPFGLDGTVSLGIVSAKGRDLEAENLLNDFIQTDAMIDHGSSGGPLVNLQGKVVGINSRGQGRGIGFTIPINTAKRVMSDLLAQGEIARGYLGIVIQPLDRELAAYWGIPEVEGIVVNGVVEDSPAEKSGIRVGDIVTNIAGQPVAAEKDEDLGTFQRLIATKPVGERVEFDLFRQGETYHLSAKLGSQPKVVPDEEETDFGFTVQELTVGLYRANRLDTWDGVFVSYVERGSEAAEAGLEIGDLVQRLDDRPVQDLESFRKTLTDTDATKPFLIRARRGPDTRFLLVAPRAARNGVAEPQKSKQP